MSRALKPARKISGTIRVPGDKSIAHRAALLSVLARGPVEIRNFPDNDDCARSLHAAEQLGVRKVDTESGFILQPRASALSESPLIDCGNSGTTARLLCGVLAGLSGMQATLHGDDSLSRRPMKRVMEPLARMGADCFSETGTLPLRVIGKNLLPLDLDMNLPSAQLKSALILAAMGSSCSLTIREFVVSRDHTEQMVMALGTGLTVREIHPVLEPDPLDPRKKRQTRPEPFDREIRVSPGAAVRGGTVDVPGDVSTASFFWTAAALTGGSVTVEGVGLNATRTAFLEHLRQIGAGVTITDKTTVGGEPRGTVTVTGGALKSRRVHGAMIPALIDELPLVALLGAFADGTTIIRDAGELRVKESDRIAAVGENLGRMGVKVAVLEDGLAIEGKTEPSGADFASFGDHRIAMTFSIAALAASGPSSIDDPHCVRISCPSFYDLLMQIVS